MVSLRARNICAVVGALEPRKGLDVLADAWARAQLAGVELLVAGEGREKVAAQRISAT